MHSVAQYSLGLLLVAAAASNGLTEATNLRQVPRNLQETSGDYFAAMLARVNKERAAKGKSALCMNKKLQAASQRHSDDMAAKNYMAHDGSDGSTMSQRITDASYNWDSVAENVAAGQSDVQSVMDSWMESPGHYENIMGDYTMFGCAMSYETNSEFKYYWTQDFATGEVEACDSDAPTPAPTQGIAEQKPTPAPTTSAPETPATVIPGTETPELPATKGPLPTPAATTPAPVATPAVTTPAPVATPAATTTPPSADIPAKEDCNSPLQPPTPEGVSVNTMLFSSPSLALLVVIATASNGVSEAASLRQRNLQTYTASDDYFSTMLDRVNQERAKYGRPTLCMNKKLQNAAQEHSNDQAANNYMDHKGSDGSTVAERINQAGYDWSAVAENVAAGQADVDAVMESWMNSPGHRKNILGDYTMFGTAYAYNANSEFKHYWTQDFSSGDLEKCDGVNANEAPLTTLVEKEADDGGYTAPETDAPFVHSPPEVETPCPETDAPVVTDPIDVETPCPETDAPVVTYPIDVETPCPETDAPVVTYPIDVETPCPETDAPVVTDPIDIGTPCPETDAPVVTDPIDVETPCPETDAPVVTDPIDVETPCPETDAPVVTDPIDVETPCPETDAPVVTDPIDIGTPCPETDAPVVVVDPPRIGTSPQHAYNTPVSMPEAHYATGTDCHSGF
ncbi:hypothetical protein BBP00_00009943 [Phytophthora kernoviae]|uniref:SCP domain-containing protein n=1 Tax=Phytophthora kernoviae TaxID=325452 RepID=A0A3F2RB38_9STRA|nr:hypothetical protein BBP00_00009943 [Phytophthora kernoviae]